jgi:hypothetical protein
MHLEHRSIGELAYRLWQSRGCPEGTAEQDWREAEEQLRAAQRAALPTLTDAVERSPQGKFPASEPPATADAKSKAAGATRKSTPRAKPQSKSIQSKPQNKPNNDAAG